MSINHNLQTSGVVAADQKISVASQSSFQNNTLPLIPLISHLTELTGENNHKLRQQIIDFVTLFPDDDYIYTFKIEKTLHNKSVAIQSFVDRNLDSNVCIAGSSALLRLSNMLKQYDATLKNEGTWNANDVDIFILKSTSNERFFTTGCNVDLIHSTDSTPQELISKFDLPCCRVAYDFNFTFYVSIQALAAIFSKKMYLPSYMKTSKSFIQMIKNNSSTKPEHSSKSYLESWYNLMGTRLEERIRKYCSRGFAPKYYDTNYILPWMTTRFAYAEFKFSSTVPSIRSAPSLKNGTSSLSNVKPDVDVQETQNQGILSPINIDTTSLEDEIMKITGRKREDNSMLTLSSVMEYFRDTYDITTVHDLCLLPQEWVVECLKTVKSLPIKSAILQLYKKNHTKVI